MNSHMSRCLVRNKVVVVLSHHCWEQTGSACVSIDDREMESSNEKQLEQVQKNIKVTPSVPGTLPAFHKDMPYYLLCVFYLGYQFRHIFRNAVCVMFVFTVILR